MSDSAVDKQKTHDSIKVVQAQIMREAFSTVAGQQALTIIMELCGEGKYLPGLPGSQGITGDSALYWFGRRDVGVAIRQIMDFTPKTEKAVVKTKA